MRQLFSSSSSLIFLLIINVIFSIMTTTADAFTIPKEFKISVNASGDGRVRFYHLLNNTNNDKESFWCADDTLSSTPTAQFENFCSGMDMKLVTSPAATTIDTTSTEITGLTTSSFFNSVSCVRPKGKTIYDIDFCTATTLAATSSCSKVYSFSCDNYKPQVDSFNAKAYVFNSQDLTNDDGVLLYRPSENREYGTICGVGSSDGTKIEETARALCGMQGYGRWKGVSFFSDSSPTNRVSDSSKTSSSDFSGIVEKRMYLSNIVCPPHALGINNCTYDISYTQNSSAGCDGGNKFPLRVKCAVPRLRDAAVFLRNAPTAKLEVRRPCSRNWQSVCDDVLILNRNSVSMCRIMGYNTNVERANQDLEPIAKSLPTAFLRNAYKDIISDSFGLDDVRCPDPRVATVLRINQCEALVSRENCNAGETIFMTTVIDPSQGSARIENLCQGWSNLINTNSPFQAFQLEANQLEECPSPSGSNREEFLNALFSSRGFVIFLIIIGASVGLCYFCCCFGVAQYDDRECCDRFDNCCNNYCDDCWDWTCSRTICCWCFNDEENAEYCCQGGCTLCENCFFHHFNVMCCQDNWNEVYERPEGPVNPAQQRREREVQLQNNEAGIAGAELAEDEIQLRERENNENAANNADEQEREAALSLKPAEVSTRYAMEQEAREVVDKFLLDIGNNNVTSLMSDDGFPPLADAPVNEDANNNTNINPLTGAAAATSHKESAIPEAPARLIQNNLNDDDDDDNDDVTATTKTNTNNLLTTTSFMSPSTTTGKSNNNIQDDVIDVPYSLARWWTRDFVSELKVEEEIFNEKSCAETKRRVRMLFGKTAKFYCGYESFNGRFSFLICCSKEQTMPTTNSNTALSSPLPPIYRNRIFEIARATNQLQQQTSNGQQQEKLREDSERSHEPIDEDVPEIVTTTSPSVSPSSQQQVAAAAAAVAPAAVSSSSAPDGDYTPTSFTSFHFYRLIDFCKLLKLKTTRMDEMLHFFGPSFRKMNPKLLFEEDESDDHDAGGATTTEATTARSNLDDDLTYQGVLSRQPSSVVTDDLGDLEDNNNDDEKHQQKKIQKENDTSSASSPFSSSWQMRCSVCFGKFFIDFPLVQSGVSSKKSNLIAQTVFPGAECSAPGRHFTCSVCLGSTISRFIQKGDVIFSSLPCYNGDCAQSLGAIVLNDFSSVLELSVWRDWQDAIKERARLVGQREIMRGGPLTKLGSSADARGQADKIRELLKPRCPKCELPFMSFSGCVQVHCVVGAKKTEEMKKKGYGCGINFCGACLKPQPCGKHGSHDFLSPAELHKQWSAWRREKVTNYLKENFAPKSAAAKDVIAAAQNYLVAASIWPLEEPWNV